MHCGIGFPGPTASVWNNISQMNNLKGDDGKPKLSPYAIYTMVCKNYYNIKELLGVVSQLPTVDNQVFKGI